MSSRRLEPRTKGQEVPVCHETSVKKKIKIKIKGRVVVLPRPLSLFSLNLFILRINKKINKTRKNLENKSPLLHLLLGAVSSFLSKQEMAQLSQNHFSQTSEQSNKGEEILRNFVRCPLDVIIFENQTQSPS